VESLREVDVVRVRARSDAKRRKLEPHQPAGALAVRDLAALDVERVMFLLHVLELREDPLELGAAALADVVHLHPLHLQPAIIHAAVHLQHVEAVLQQLDRRKEALALQPVGVELVRCMVAGHDEFDPAIHHPSQVAAEDHRIGDVGDVEFIEAHQPIAARGALRHRGEGVLASLQFVQLAMDLAHEVVEVHAALSHQRHAEVEAVHEKALAAAHAAPEVYALGQRRLDEQAPERRAAPRLVGAPFLEQALQPLDRAPLGRVGDEAAARQVLLVERDHVGSPGARSRQGV
jgi:hypothetical protein